MSSGMPWSLEVACVPVSDIDRAKAFYAGQLSFEVDHDSQVSAGVRFVQLTSPGSGRSIVARDAIAGRPSGRRRHGSRHPQRTADGSPGHRPCTSRTRRAGRRRHSDCGCRAGRTAAPSGR